MGSTDLRVCHGTPGTPRDDRPAWDFFRIASMYLFRAVGSPGWNRVNWTVKIWVCHGAPGTPTVSIVDWNRANRGPLVLYNIMQTCCLVFKSGGADSDRLFTLGCPKYLKNLIFASLWTFRILRISDLNIFKLRISWFASLRFELRISRISRIYSENCS